MRRETLGKAGCLATLVFAVMFLTGCEALNNSGLFDFFKRKPGPADSSQQSELGLGKLAKGDLLQAQAMFDEALRRNPRDVHALLGKAMVFQQTGQLTQARSAYEAVLALRPSAAEKMVIWSNLSPRTVSEIASVNLNLLQSRGVRDRFGRPVPGARPGQSAPQGARRPAPLAAPGRPPAPRSAASIRGLSPDDANIISRFKTLAALRDQGLITPGEYKTRRRVNAGALLRYTLPPPAAGLNRPVPSATQIVGRLRAIGRALELRAMSVR